MTGRKIISIKTRQAVEPVVSETGQAIVVAPVEIDTESLALAQSILAEVQAGRLFGLCIIGVNVINNKPTLAACDTLNNLAHETLRLYALRLVEEGLLDAMDERTNFIEPEDLETSEVELELPVEPDPPGASA